MGSSRNYRAYVIAMENTRLNARRKHTVAPKRRKATQAGADKPTQVLEAIPGYTGV